MMHKLLLLVIVGCVAAATDDNSVRGRIPSQNPTTELPSSSTQKTTTTPATTIPPSTKKTTTPVPTTQPTTTAPTTTAKPPPSPPSPPNTTTTEKPTTTTTVTPPTTTTKPTPIPTKPIDPIPGTWAVNYTNTNRTCIVVTLAAQIEVPYILNGTSNSNYTGYVNISPTNNTSANGTCGNVLQSITLYWNNTNNATNSVTLSFAKRNVNSTKFDLFSIDITIVPDNATMPGYNATIAQFKESTPLFNTSLTHSYKCFKRQTFNLTNTANITAGYIHLQHVQLQAFRNTTGTVFAEAEDCAPRETPDVVPIAVGCALVALIIIVLVAYLIGRRRNQARGYLSMFSAEKKEADYIPMKNLNCFN